jgi:signal transduction histidine kinase
VDPARVRTGEIAPPVVIEGLRVDGREEPGHRYPPGRGEVVVDYSALRLKAAGRMRFRYRLEGFDEVWTEAGARRQAQYSALPPGEYRFTVSASNGDGEYNGPPASVAFAIAPALYRRTGFWLACAAALLMLLGVAHRGRTARLRARFAAVLDERARIARELHDTLAQSLTGMAVQMEAALGSLDPEGESAARRHLQRVRTMVTASLAEVRRSIWVLRAQAAPAPDLDAVLEDSLAQLCAQGTARFELRVEGVSRAVSADAQRHVLRIAHEAVTNAVRHAAARTIEVVLRYEADALHVQVRDDGRGFDTTAAKAASAEHYGLVGMRERAQVLGGELEIESRPGGGTQVDCRVPC